MGTGVSPAKMLFGRNLRDHLPRNNRELRPEWGVIADSREQALAKRALKEIETAKRDLKPLCIGDSVQIQNQTGNHPDKWFCTGVVAEVLPNRQYQVVVDGSRRTSLRNRRFLKKILPISRKEFDLTPDVSIHHTPQNHDSLSTTNIPPVEGEPVNVGTDGEVTSDVAVGQREVSPPLQEMDTVMQGLNVGHVWTEASPPTPPTGLRRSGRVVVPRKTFTAKLRGKYHE